MLLVSNEKKLNALLAGISRYRIFSLKEKNENKFENFDI